MKDRQNATIRYLKMVAEKFGYVLNPNEKALGLITGYLTENKIKHDKYFCPCKQHFPVDLDNDPFCPCPTFKEEVARIGFCECHVFFDPAAAEKASRMTGLLSTVTCPG